MKKNNRLIPTWKITRVSFVFSSAYCSRIKWSYLMLRKSSIRLRLSYFMNTNHFVANHFPHCRLKKKKKIILVPMRGTWNTKSRIRNLPLCFTYFSSEVFIICKSINRRSSRLLLKRKLSSLNCYEIFFSSIEHLQRYIHCMSCIFPTSQTWKKERFTWSQRLAIVQPMSSGWRHPSHWHFELDNLAHLK